MVTKHPLYGKCVNDYDKMEIADSIVEWKSSAIEECECRTGVALMLTESSRVLCISVFIIELTVRL